MTRRRPLSPTRRAEFARDWNEGLPTDALKEKYEGRVPHQVAHKLRQLGYRLTRRHGVVLLLALALAGCAMRPTDARVRDGRLEVILSDPWAPCAKSAACREGK